MTLTSAVREACAGLGGPDKAAVELAVAYAETIDGDREVLSDLGPKLLATLAALNLTPASRGAKGGADVRPASPLDELRQRRAARADRAQAVHAAAP